MKKLLLGGSPCTYWSIAQKNGRETEASGVGWELFENYVIAKTKFAPDFFLYENNKSAAQPIKDQIAHLLGVELMHINSALVSAQNRERFYAVNWAAPQPADRGIYLRDVLETGIPLNASAKEKAYTLRANHSKGGPANLLGGGHHYPQSGATEPMRIGTIDSTAKNQDHDSRQYRVYSPEGKGVTLCGNGGGMGAKTGLYATQLGDAAPVRIGTIVNGKHNSESQSNRVYSVLGKSVTLCGGQGGKGAQTGLYLTPHDGGKVTPVYEVKDGIVVNMEERYPVKLADGFYIIRKLTPVECERLQTLPDGYTAGVSNSRRYQGLGNGWTAEVIIHLLRHGLAGVPRDEELVVLSMYDGIGTGRYCLDQLGFTNVRYYAYEVDTYAMQIASKNYPGIVQCGDAYAVRESGWCLPGMDPPPSMCPECLYDVEAAPLPAACKGCDGHRHFVPHREKEFEQLILEEVIA